MTSILTSTELEPVTGAAPAAGPVPGATSVPPHPGDCSHISSSPYARPSTGEAVDPSCLGDGTAAGTETGPGAVPEAAAGSEESMAQWIICERADGSVVSWEAGVLSDPPVDVGPGARCYYGPRRDAIRFQHRAMRRSQ